MNYSVDVDHVDFDLLRSPVWRALITSLYLLVILMGIVGNTLVVYVVIKHKQLQNITNVFIANLAISDIGLCVFNLPIQLHYQLTDNWVFGSGLCRVVFAAFAIPVYISSITILMIAVHRYWIIVHPLRKRLNFRSAIFLIFFIAGLSMVFSVPIMYFSSLYSINDDKLNIHRNYCVEYWPSYAARIIYTVLAFVFHFVLPLVLTVIIYYRIYFRLQQRSLSNHMRTHRTNIKLITIVTVFCVCWLPWNLFTLLAQINMEMMKGNHFKFTDLLLKLLAMSSACINPFLYGWLNESFFQNVDTVAVGFRARYSMEMRVKNTQGQGVPKKRCLSTEYNPDEQIKKQIVVVYSGD